MIGGQTARILAAVLSAFDSPRKAPTATYVRIAQAEHRPWVLTWSAPHTPTLRHLPPPSDTTPAQEKCPLKPPVKHPWWSKCPALNRKSESNPCKTTPHLREGKLHLSSPSLPICHSIGECCLPENTPDRAACAAGRQTGQRCPGQTVGQVRAPILRRQAPSPPTLARSRWVFLYRPPNQNAARANFLTTQANETRRMNLPGEFS
jgi:hypothetical protein